MPLAKAAELFATLNLTMAEACIAIWNTKHHYNYWRPVTAIRRADEDNNAATIADKAWEPLRVTPLHPECVSGHSGVSGAAATILTSCFGSEGIHFSVSGDDVPDVKRKLTSFQTCAEAVSRNRVFGAFTFLLLGVKGW